MMSSQAFALMNLGLWVAILVLIALAQRRGRDVFTTRHRGVRYRRMTTATVLKLIGDRESGASARSGASPSPDRRGGAKSPYRRGWPQSGL